MKSKSPLTHCEKPQRNTVNVLIAISILALCVGSIPVVQTHAEDAYEGFDYPDGTDLDDQDGGTGWGNAWSGGLGDAASRFTVADSLNYPGIAATGNKLQIEGSRIFRNLGEPLTEGNTYYIRVMMQKDPEEDSMSYFGLMLAGGAGEKLLIGSGTGYEHWMLAGNFSNGAGVDAGEVFPPGHADEGDPTNTLTSTVSNKDLALLVVKLEMRPVETGNLNGLEQLTFWVNPDLSQPENASSAVGGQSFPSFSNYGDLDRMRIGGGGTGAAGSKHLVDEIHISQDSPFADAGPVIPVVVPDTVKPRLKITNKKALKTSRPRHAIKGLARDNVAVAKVEVKSRLQKGWKKAKLRSNGKVKFKTKRLKTGRNVHRFRAFDTSGNRSKIVKAKPVGK